MALIPSTLFEKAEFPAIFDSSILVASSCPTKFFYQHCLNLHPVAKSIHLHAGGSFAAALETTRKSFYLDAKPLDIAILDGYRTLIDYWGTYDDVPAEGTGSYKDFINVTAAFIDYFHAYDPRTDHIQPYKKHDGSPAVEFTFSIPLPILHPLSGEPILYAGRCDMIGLYNEKSLCILDEKTAYSFTNDWAKNYTLRGQFIGYCFAAQQFDLPVNLCVVRGIGIQQKSIKHLEAILTFPQFQIERWYSEMLKKIEAMKEFWLSRDFPMSYGTDCSSFGGCSVLDLCQAHIPEQWISTFEVRKWNPLSKQIKDSSI